MIAVEAEQSIPKEVPKSDPAPSHQRTLTRSSAVSQKSVEIMVHPEAANNPLHRSKLAPSRSTSETQSSGKKILNLRKTKNSSIESTMSLPNQKSLEKNHGSLRHQKTIGAHSDVTLSTQPSITDDRKAVRGVLYQGIFHRHRRTIFAMGSFIRMLKSKTSNYDSIRSDSDEI
ncbi:uncharacterized protein LOC131848883 [Achroia grisella]|uniref:uncharacterized protein LOC131843576 n=1 Tax=Achroia grisella TaxID=688607 RepID=UPI0027D31CF9|nr:uncharacterized protein LOC131843576 [Achroia grisella]XP_059054820.1 uncharacterized protein LOC131848883 [Achroia grisella]